ncbi:MAG: class IV adenylate cyclase [Sulfolobales archaeon]
MREEYEVKIRVKDLSTARSNIVRLGGKYLGTYVEEDYYVDLRNCVPAEHRDLVFRVRIRESGGVREGELTVKGPKKTLQTFRIRDEVNIKIERPEDLVDLLKNLKFKMLRVVKTREVYLLGMFKIFLDSVLGLGDYVEVELIGGEVSSAVDGELRKLLEGLGVEYEVMSKSYAEMLAEVSRCGE